jgi:predicted ATPase/class 3 adenylate cyclase/DNA-binding NarL/FixJ family response regulator
VTNQVPAPQTDVVARTPLLGGTVTFVLGDMAGSTRLWETHPEDMPAVLARVEELVDDHAATYGGHRPAEQGEGDNFVVAFGKAGDAVAFAAVLQTALWAEPWPHALPVAVRMAAHTGDARHRDGERYMGEALNRCARLRALGHGGQVLVSGATAALTAETLGADLYLRDLGTHPLRDLGHPERVAQLCGPELPSQFPPLRSLNRMLTNLPGQITTFVGRAAELAEATLLIGDRRLLTLTGAGGCGKTRLALQLGAETLDAFPDGVWVAQLAPLADPDLVAKAVATAAGVAELPGQPVLDTLCDRLAGSCALIVLDNCEHLLDGCVTVVETLLRRCPDVRVLATSREPLAAEGETAYRVPSLGLPAGEDDAGCESVQLFADRASLARPMMRVGASELAAMAEICGRLDGIPLAIELAAARCRSLTPRQIADALAVHFNLLTGGSRSALSRHRSVEASIQWSYDLLGDERDLLHRLSVFAGGFTFEAAEAVGADDPAASWIVLDELTRLVDKSLLMEGHGGRYQLLEPVRQFAARRLADLGGWDAARERHAAYFLTMVTPLEEPIHGPDLVAVCSRLEADVDNLRAAADWALETGSLDLSVDLTLPVRLFWQMKHLEESANRFDRMLALSGGSTEARLWALSMAAECECLRGDIEKLCRHTEDARALLDTIDAAPDLRGYMLVYAAWGRHFLGDHGAAEDAEEAVALLRASGKPRAIMTMLDGLWELGWIAMAEGRPDEGLEHFRASLAAARTLNSPLAVGRCSAFVGTELTLRGRLAEAVPLLAEGERLMVECGDDAALWATCALRWSEGLQGDPGPATCGLRETLDSARRLGQGIVVAWGAWQQAILESRTDGVADREATITEATEMMAATGFTWGAAWAEALRAEARIAAGDLVAARAAASNSLAMAEANPRMELARGPAELALARVARAEGDLVAAEAAARRALTALTTCHLALHAVDALELLAELLAGQGNHAEAARLLGAVANARVTLTYPTSPDQAPRLAAQVENVRASLGADIYDATYAKGATLSPEGAVAYASRGRGPRRQAASGWESLTATELEVVGLVVAGLRNPEIAATLFVSPETIKSHVSNVLAKLGVANRTELAALAARRH